MDYTKLSRISDEEKTPKEDLTSSSSFENRWKEAKQEVFNKPLSWFENFIILNEDGTEKGTALDVFANGKVKNETSFKKKVMEYIHNDCKDMLED